MIHRAIAALRECECRLRDLVSEAAGAADYEAVIQLTAWAKTLAALPASKHQLSDTSRRNGAASVKRVKRMRPSHRRSKRAQRSRHAKGATSGTYPKFARVRDELIKIGWSKKEKKEYQHKAPRRVVDLLVERLSQVGADGELFTTEDLFPLHDSVEKTEIPAYQAYLALAWLREQNLIERVGRQGYQPTNCAGLGETVDRCWQNLPSSMTQ